MFTTVIKVTVLAYLAQNLITPASTPNIYLCTAPHTALAYSGTPAFLAQHSYFPLVLSCSYLLAPFHSTKNAPPDTIRTERFFWKKVTSLCLINFILQVFYTNPSL